MRGWAHEIAFADMLSEPDSVTSELKASLPVAPPSLMATLIHTYGLHTIKAYCLEYCMPEAIIQGRLTL